MGVNSSKCEFFRRDSTTSSQLAAAESYRKIPNASLHNEQWMNTTMDDSVEALFGDDRTRRIDHLEREIERLNLQLDQLELRAKEDKRALKKLRLVEIQDKRTIINMRGEMQKLAAQANEPALNVIFKSPPLGYVANLDELAER